MATITVIGELGVQAVTTGQSQKVPALSTNDDRLEHGVVGFCSVSLSAESGDISLSSVQSRAAYIDISGTTTAATTIIIQDSIQKTWWVRNLTTSGDTVQVKTTGNVAITVPERRWIQIHAIVDDAYLVSGWNPWDEAGSISSWGTNWADTSGRAIRLTKNDAQDNLAGGLVHIEGAAEKSTSVPANGDTIMTLPQYYRPAFDVTFLLTYNGLVSSSADLVVVSIATTGVVTLRNNPTGVTYATGEEIDFTGVQFFVEN